MKKLIIALLFYIINFNSFAQKYTDKYIQEANTIAINWFKKINSKDYKTSYQMLANELKEKYTKEQWVFFMNELMIEFGGINTRNIQKKLFKSQIDGLEDGFYVLIEYKSDYSNTNNHFEFLILKQNDEMNWEILDYYYEFEETKH